MRKLSAVAVAVLVLGLGGQAFAQGRTATASGSTSVKVIQPISLSSGAELRFGQLVQPASFSTVNVNETGTIDIAGVNPIALAGITQVGTGRGNGTFSVSGEANASFNLSFDTSTTLTRTGGSETMVVASVRRTGPSGVQVLSNTGTATYGLGGTLEVKANQAIGPYTGTITITATYQ